MLEFAIAHPYVVFFIFLFLFFLIDEIWKSWLLYRTERLEIIYRMPEEQKLPPEEGPDSP